MESWCKERSIPISYVTVIQLIMDGMSMDEAVAQYDCMMAGWSGYQAKGWEHVKHMFADGGWRPDEVQIWGMLLMLRADDSKGDAS